MSTHKKFDIEKIALRIIDILPPSDLLSVDALQKVIAHEMIQQILDNEGNHVDETELRHEIDWFEKRLKLLTFMIDNGLDWEDIKI